VGGKGTGYDSEMVAVPRLVRAVTADRTLNGSPRLTSLLIGSDCFVSKEKRDQGQADQTGHKEQVRNPLTPRTHPTLA
jgi:hypothetical protein